MNNEERVHEVAAQIERCRGLLEAGKIDRDTHEERVKTWTINPMLRALGWDTTDPYSVVTEHQIGRSRTRADYALMSEDKPLVLMEAKRIDGANTKAEEQLFRYAAHQGIALLVLVTGSQWDFYLAMAEGRSPDRLFASVKIEEGDPPETLASELMVYLSYEEVVSGRAKIAAERKMEWVSARRKASGALHGVFCTMLGNEDIATLLAEATERQCGCEPSMEDVREFLAKCSDTLERARNESGRRRRKPAAA